MAGPRQPASIQDEMRATFVRKDDLVASHAQAPSYRPAALPTRRHADRTSLASESD